MPKKMIASTMLLSLFFAMPAFAEAKIEVLSKNLVQIPELESAFFYAKVENTGDEAGYLDNGRLVIKSDEGELLASSDIISSLPSFLLLQPGEHTYVSTFLWESALADTAAGDIEFSMSAGGNGNDAETIPCEAELELVPNSVFDNYVVITITNDSEETRYGYYLQCGLMDADGNLVCTAGMPLENVGIHPQSTVSLKVPIETDAMEYCRINSITIADIDPIVYYMPE